MESAVGRQRFLFLNLRWSNDYFLNMTNEELLSLNSGKKFDIVLMNPPYDRSLHLKFLEKAIENAEKVVSVQPIRWLEEKVGKYKKNSAYNKYENSIAKHIKELEIIDAKATSDKFGIALNFNAGIYVCDKNGGYDYKKLSSNKIVDKIFDKLDDTLNDHVEMSEPKSAIIIPMIVGGDKGRNVVIDLYYQTAPYEKVIYDEDGKRLDNGLTFYENRKKTAWGNVTVKSEAVNIKFDTIDECINFFKSTRTYLYRYLFNQITVDVNVHLKYLPFMGDYTHEWTNEDMYKYFNITDDEQKMIEEHIGKLENEIWEKEKENNKTRKRK